MTKNNIMNNKGVTLVEVLIALTILLFVFLVLLQTSLISIQGNMRNVIRDEAVRITSETMALLQSRSFDDMDGNVTPDPSPLTFNNDQQRNIRNINNFPFTVRIDILELTSTQKQITVTTQWTWQGENFQHQIMTTR